MLSPFGFDDHDALGLAELVRRGEVHPRELVAAAIQRVEEHNPRLNAVVHKLYDRALQIAERGGSQGPFAGVPYLLKDMVAHQGTPLTMGTALLRKLGHVPSRSHEVVRRSEQAGLIVIGKTNACELGLLPTTEPTLFGPTANPWEPGHSPGGSSGGSAAAVAARLLPMAHANDGGGSIRIPASACGVFGLKPSRGRNPQSEEDVPEGFTVEHCVSISVRDSAALLDATRGPRPGDRFFAPPPERPYLDEVSVDPGRLRIAFSVRDLTGRPAHPDCVAAVEDAAKLLAGLGHQVEEGAPPIDGERFDEAFLKLWLLLPTFFFKMVGRHLSERRWADLASRVIGEQRLLRLSARIKGLLGDPLFEPLTLEMVELAAQLDAGDAWLASSDVQLAGRQLCEFLTEYDLWLTPVLAAPPVKTGEIHGRLSADTLRERATRYAAYTVICNMAGVPSMSVPLSWNAAGLPVGVHFAGRFADEATLFRLAGQLERARPWSQRRPPL
jgi:amidase